MGPVEVDTQASRFPTRWWRQSSQIPLLAYPRRFVAAAVAVAAMAVADLLVAVVADYPCAPSCCDSSELSTEVVPSSRPARSPVLRCVAFVANASYDSLERLSK